MRIVIPQPDLHLWFQGLHPFAITLPQAEARLPWANLVAVAEPSLPASEVADEPPTLTKEEPVPLETQVRGPCFPHFQERKDPRDLVDRTALLW